MLAHIHENRRMSDLCAPVILSDVHVELRPLHPDHLDGLIAAASDGELWKLWYTLIPEPEDMAAEIARRLELQSKGQMTPFTVVSPDEGRIVGMTSYMHIDQANRRLEIGGTWYARSVQRGPLNTEAKRLLLARAFDDLECIAVELRTHAMNQQSRRAIERLGAKLDGILRSHQRTRNGALRDTCVYSITAAEWPTVRANLDWQLERPR
jgi:RimJ/RimL family protein N-acetyltransferase